MGYSLQPRRAYDAVKFGIKGTDYTIVLKNAGTRHYQQLVNEFTSIMNDIVDETLGNADPNDYVRFVLKSSDFDRPLNTSYQDEVKSAVHGFLNWQGNYCKVTNLSI